MLLMSKTLDDVMMTKVDSVAGRNDFELTAAVLVYSSTHLGGGKNEREGTLASSMPACHVSVFEKASVPCLLFLRDVLSVKVMALFFQSWINNGVIYYSGPGFLDLALDLYCFLDLGLNLRKNNDVDDYYYLL